MRAAVAVAVGLRVGLAYSSWLQARPELTTPLSSMRRVREGVELGRAGMSPWAGDMFHQPPLVLAFFRPFFGPRGPRLHGLPLMFAIALADVLTALAIRGTVAQLVGRINAEARATFGSSADLAGGAGAGAGAGAGGAGGEQKRANFERLLEPVPGKYAVPFFALDLAKLPSTCMVAYLMHPFSILSCGALDTDVLPRCAVALGIFFASRGNSAASSLCIALAGYVRIHPLVLVFATAALRHEHERISAIDDAEEGKTPRGTARNGRARSPGSAGFPWTLLTECVLVVLWSLALQGISWNMVEPRDGHHLTKTYAFHLTAPDHTPNIGLFWYFFSLLFKRFRGYFRFAFSAIFFIYVIPLAYRMWRRPLVMAVTLLMFIGTITPYPTLGDVAIPMVLMMGHPFLVARMRFKVVILTAIAVCATLLPVMWYLWLYLGSFCANHFYFAQLGYIMITLLLTTEFLAAAVIRDRQTDDVGRKRAASAGGENDAGGETLDARKEGRGAE